MAENLTTQKIAMATIPTRATLPAIFLQNLGFVLSITMLLPLRFFTILGMTFTITSTITTTRISSVDNAFIVGFVRFVMLYTTIEMLDTPFPVTK